MLGPDMEAVILVRQEVTIVYNISYVVGRRQPPTAILIHDKREVLIMVIGVVGQNVEYHPTEHLLAVGFRQMQLTTNGYQLLIAVSIRTNGSQRLGINLPLTVTIETLGDKMVVTVNII